MQAVLKRLEVIKHSIQLGEDELIPNQLARLADVEDNRVLEIVLALQAGHYHQSLTLIEAYLTQSKGLVLVENGETAALKLELKRLEGKLLELSEEKQSIQHTINRFRTQYHQELGALMQAILDCDYRIHYQKIQLKAQQKAKIQANLAKVASSVELLKAKIKTLQQSDLEDDDLAQLHEVLTELKTEKDQLKAEEATLEAFEESLSHDEDYQDYQQVKQDKEQFSQRNTQVIEQAKYELAEDELMALKKSYRKAAKLCHPDTFLFDEDNEDKSNVMVELNLAYEAQDLHSVQQILLTLENPSQEADRIDHQTYIDNLHRKIEELTQLIDKNIADIANLKADPDYRRIQQIEDWGAYFEEIKQQFTTQLSELQEEEASLTGVSVDDWDDLDELETEDESVVSVEVVDELQPLVADFVALVQDYEGFRWLRLSLEDHVNRWLNQFDDGIRVALLRELYHVLQKTYLSKAKMMAFIRQMIVKIADQHDAGIDCWQRLHLLNIQQGGNSQKVMVRLFKEILAQEYGITRDEQTQAEHYVYLDDVIFTGSRVKTDLNAFIQQINWSQVSVPITIYIVSFARHNSGTYYLQRELRHPHIHFEFLCQEGFELMNLKESIETSETDCLVPTRPLVHHALYDQYVAKMTYKPVFRTPKADYLPTSTSALFSSEANRSLLEQVLLDKGLVILQQSPFFKVYHRPLGYSKLETLGFGSLMVTYRNCPNNAPLALWAGSPWYALFPRITNKQAKTLHSL